METQRAIQLAGSPKALAELFGITTAAVSQWGKELPEGRKWQLRVIRPEWFEKTPKGQNPKRRASDRIKAA